MSENNLRRFYLRNHASIAMADLKKGDIFYYEERQDDGSSLHRSSLWTAEADAEPDPSRPGRTHIQAKALVVTAEDETETDKSNPIAEHGEPLQKFDTAPALSASSVAHFIPMPGGLHPATAAMVAEFATAVSNKLYKVQVEKGRILDWQQPGWEDECRKHLRECVEKGDPIDVAALCAFLNYHGEPTNIPSVNSSDA